jgi:NTE family protein
MIDSRNTHDLIVVQLVPDQVDSAPTDASGIRRRVNEIVFNSSLVAEIQAIRAMRALATRTDSEAGVVGTRLHRIGPPPSALLTMGSALERSRPWLERLFAEGRAAARRFSARHGRQIGVRETLDVAHVFARDPRLNADSSANEDSFDRGGHSAGAMK